MRVLALTHAARWSPECPDGYAEMDRFVAASRADRFGKHVLVGSAAEADLILYIKAARPDCRDILSDPLYRSRPERCFLFELADNPFPYVPGVYAGIQRCCYSRSRTRTGHYLAVATDWRAEAAGDPVTSTLLCSFMGRLETHPVRARLATLSGGDVYVRDVPSLPETASSADRLAHRQIHLDAMRRSSFVLCPRGYGVSSRRLFEAMQAGRCPVVISDDWVPPVGPVWSQFSVRVAERDVGSIPSRLEALRPNAAQMGALARRAWEEWFSSEASFHRIIEWCLDIARSRRCPEWLAFRLMLWRRMPHWYHRRRGARAVPHGIVRSRMRHDRGLDPVRGTVRSSRSPCCGDTCA